MMSMLPCDHDLPGWCSLAELEEMVALPRAGEVVQSDWSGGEKEKQGEDFLCHHAPEQLPAPGNTNHIIYYHRHYHILKSLMVLLENTMASYNNKVKRVNRGQCTVYMNS